MKPREATDGKGGGSGSGGGQGGGGMADALAQIRKGSVALRHVEATPRPLTRQPSDSIASVLKRKMAQRKALIQRDEDDDDGAGDWD